MILHSAAGAVVGGMIAVVGLIGRGGVVMYCVSSSCVLVDAGCGCGASGMRGGGTCQILVSRVCLQRGWIAVRVCCGGVGVLTMLGGGVRCRASECKLRKEGSSSH